MVLNSLLILLLSEPIATIAPSAMRAAIRAYSIRSWPDSSFIRFLNNCFICVFPLIFNLSMLWSSGTVITLPYGDFHHNATTGRYRPFSGTRGYFRGSWARGERVPTGQDASIDGKLIAFQLD